MGLYCMYSITPITGHDAHEMQFQIVSQGKFIKLAKFFPPKTVFLYLTAVSLLWLMDRHELFRMHLPDYIDNDAYWS